MSVEVSVVVAAGGASPVLPLLRSLDEQSMPVDRFEVVLVDEGLPAAELDSLRRVAARRPNLTLAAAADPWLESLRGRWVLTVGPDHRLFPEALDRLLGCADAHHLDVVAARTVQPRQSFSPAYLSDSAGLEGGDRDAALAGSVLLASRDLVRSTPAGIEVVGEGARVGVLSTYPAAARLAAPTLPPTNVELSVGHAALSWASGGLELVLNGALASRVGIDLTPVVLLRHAGTQLSYLLPSQGEVESLEDQATTVWHCSSRFSPLTAAAGQPLPEGLWELDVCVTGQGGASAPVPVKLPAVNPAILPGLLVSAGTSTNGVLQLDVGATRHPLVSQPEPVGATVQESARGSLLRLPLPAVHVQTGTTVSGAIALGRLELPATIEVSGGVAVLSAYVSGLPGVSPISARFGAGQLRQTGLSLDIAAAGSMTVVRTPAAPAPAPAAAPKPAAAPAKPPAQPAAKKPTGKKPAAKKPKRTPPPAKGPVARLRRSIPAPLEPLVSRVSHSPAARRAYRKLTGLAP